MWQTVQNISIFYEKSGSGEPLLLLHGNGEDHHIFDPLAKKLSAHYTVYAIDSRCHGKSTMTSDLSYASMTNDIACFIDALSLAPTHIIGFSDGAILALMLAMQQPQSIRKMALLGVNLSPQDFTDDSMQFLTEAYSETQDPFIQLMLNEPNLSIKDVSRVQTPTFIIAAQYDIFKPETYTALHQALSNSSLQIMQGQEHDTYIVNTDILYLDLHTFLSET